MKQLITIFILLIGINFTSSAQIKIGNDNGSPQAKFIKSYPNPASTVVNFEFQKGYSRSFSIQILNSIGKKMYEVKNMPSLLTIDLKAEKFYRGIYIYQLIDKNGFVIESGKILIVN
ncbi:T9SS type A sorting domain-containing protein [Ferruginibacter yonginensis]|uniref:T9SS type A sorting domain-containing protein n=1 Tax=Ferruginibacter yonginensis TaxID=1310416 RepID=A0ABV8QPT4_9BACT